jgi:hypothetical protein
MNKLGDNMNPGKWTEAEIRRLDFAWSRFIEPVFRFDEDCRKARQQGRTPVFQLVDYESKWR